MNFLPEINHDLSLAKKYALVGSGAGLSNLDPTDVWDATLLKAWWDPSETNWKNSAAQDFITFNGSDVSQIDDRSGNNNDLAQSVEANQPTTGSINSIRSILFQLENLDNSSLSSTQPTMIFLGANITTWGNSQALFDGSVSDGRNMLRKNGAGTLLEMFAGAVSATSVAPPTGANHLFGVLYNGASSEFWLDAVLEDTESAGAQNLSGFRLGSIWDGTAEMTHVDVMDVFIVDEDPSDSNRQKAEGFLAWKWGMEDNLPVDHPYKNEQPLV